MTKRALLASIVYTSKDILREAQKDQKVADMQHSHSIHSIPRKSSLRILSVSLLYRFEIPLPKGKIDNEEARLLGLNMQPLLRRYSLPATVGRSKFIPLLIQQLIKNLFPSSEEKVCTGEIEVKKSNRCGTLWSTLKLSEPTKLGSIASRVNLI